MTRIAINGLGRIGRLVVRRFHEVGAGNLDLIALNDIYGLEDLSYLLKYDSVHGKFTQPFSINNNKLDLNGASIESFCETDWERLPWGKFDIDIIVDCTGKCGSREEAHKHLQAGAKKVLISAPLQSADFTLVYGVNNMDYDANKHNVISNASCTTNSLVPPLKILLDNFGIESVLATTVHAYTISQSLLDKVSKNAIRGRAGALNIIPTSTGSDLATVMVLPELKDRISVTALRVPVSNGSISDINAVLTRPASPNEINEALKSASNNEMSGVMEYSTENLVSSDIIGNPHSSIIHSASTRVIKGTNIKIQSWYDNEYAYVCRLVDTLCLIGNQLH